MTVALIIAAGLVGLGDWIAVARRLFRVEYLLKPLTLVVLIVAAAVADVGDSKAWLVTALVFGLIGDIALMFSPDRPDRAGRPDGAPGAPGAPDLPFLLGLSAFLVGHLCYLGAFAAHGLHPLSLIAGLLIVGGASLLALPRVLGGVRRAGGTQLAATVAGYSVVLAAMAVFAVGTGSVLTALGGLLFLGSDVVLAWHRFVYRLQRGPVLVIVSYHVGQILILAGLLRSV